MRIRPATIMCLAVVLICSCQGERLEDDYELTQEQLADVRKCLKLDMCSYVDPFWGMLEGSRELLLFQCKPSGEPLSTTTLENMVALPGF